jgi:hypothetical protein
MGIIGRVLGIFRKKKPAEVKICGGMPSGKKRHHKPRPVTTEIITEPELHVKGEMFRRLNIGYKKPIKPKEIKAIRLAVVKDDNTKELLFHKWQSLIGRLEREGRVFISRNEHYGGLRGRDILRFAKRDLRRLGYDVEVKFGDYDGYMWIRGCGE